MQEKEVRDLCVKGAIDNIEIQRNQNRRAWIVCIKSDCIDAADQALASKRRPDVRLFKTTDAALRWCQNMGFNNVQVKLPKQEEESVN